MMLSIFSESSGIAMFLSLVPTQNEKTSENIVLNMENLRLRHSCP